MKCNGHLTRLAHSYFGCPTTITTFYFLMFKSHIAVNIVEINNVVVVDHDKPKSLEGREQKG